MQFLIKTKSLKLPQKLPATLLCAPWPFFLLFFLDLLWSIPHQRWP